MTTFTLLEAFASHKNVTSQKRPKRRRRMFSQTIIRLPFL